MTVQNRYLVDNALQDRAFVPDRSSDRQGPLTAEVCCFFPNFSLQFSSNS